MKRFFVITLILVLSACSVRLAMPTTHDVERMKEKYPGYTLQELNDGKILYEQNCHTCHTLKNPVDYSEQQWTLIVPKMVAKVNKKAGNTVIDKDYEKVLLRYLVTMGSAPSAK